MKDKNLLIEEINRIGELMGTSKKLSISEITQNGGKKLLMEGPAMNSPASREIAIKFLESMGFKNVEKISERNLGQLVKKLTKFDSELTQKFSQNIKNAINQATKKVKRDASGNRIVTTAPERLESIIKAMESDIASLENSLNSLRGKTSAELDYLFFNTINSNSGRNTRSVFEYLMRNNPTASEDDIISFMAQEPGYAGFGGENSWYWSRFKESIQYNPTTNKSEWKSSTEADRIYDNVGKMEKAEIEASTNTDPNWFNKWLDKPQDISGTLSADVEAIFERNTAYRRLSPKEKERVVNQVSSYIEKDIKKTLDDMTPALEEELQRLDDVFSSNQVYDEVQKENLIRAAIERLGLGMKPWNIDAVAIKNRFQLKDNQGESLFKGNRFKKIETEGSKIGESSYTPYSVAFGVLNTLAGWTFGNLVVAAIGSVYDYIKNEDVRPEDLGENGLEQWYNRMGMGSALQRIIIPLPWYYAGTIRNLISLIEKGLGGRFPSKEEVVESDEWKFKNVKPADLIQSPVTDSPDCADDGCSNFSQYSKDSYYITDQKGTNYGIWTYSREKDGATILNTPANGILPTKDTTVTTGTYTDDVAGFTKWYAARGNNYKEIVNKADKEVWNPGKDNDKYYAHPEGKKRWKFVDESTGFKEN